MANMPGARGGGGDPDVYTALVFVALLSSLTATIIVGAKMASTFGSILPQGGS